MRSDYMLYAMGVIFFILTGVVTVYSIEQQQLWIVATAVLGLVFVGLGYWQRPSLAVSTTATSPVIVPQPATPAQPVTTEPATTEPVKEEKTEQIIEVPPPTKGLTKVKGIGEKRAEQLKALGIKSVEELAKASGRDLARKLKISPKITGKWVENAKGLVEKS